MSYDDLALPHAFWPYETNGIARALCGAGAVVRFLRVPEYGRPPCRRCLRALRKLDKAKPANYASRQGRRKAAIGMAAIVLFIAAWFAWMLLAA